MFCINYQVLIIKTDVSERDFGNKKTSLSGVSVTDILGFRFVVCKMMVMVKLLRKM